MPLPPEGTSHATLLVVYTLYIHSLLYIRYICIYVVYTFGQGAMHVLKY